MSWNIFDLFLWAQLELQLGIMCAAAPSLRVFFRRYLGNSSASRAFKSGGKSTGRGTPGPTTLGSSVGPDKSITVVRTTHVTSNDGSDLHTNKKPFEESLDTVGESSDGRAWSPTPSKERLTRKSEDEDAIAMQDMTWKNPGRSRWSGKF